MPLPLCPSFSARFRFRRASLWKLPLPHHPSSRPPTPLTLTSKPPLCAPPAPSAPRRPQRPQGGRLSQSPAPRTMASQGQLRGVLGPSFDAISVDMADRVIRVAGAQAAAQLRRELGWKNKCRKADPAATAYPSAVHWFALPPVSGYVSLAYLSHHTHSQRCSTDRPSSQPVFRPPATASSISRLPVWKVGTSSRIAPCCVS